MSVSTCSTYRVISCSGDVPTTECATLWAVEQQCGKELFFSVLVEVMKLFYDTVDLEDHITVYELAIMEQ